MDCLLLSAIVIARPAVFAWGRKSWTVDTGTVLLSILSACARRIRHAPEAICGSLCKPDAVLAAAGLEEDLLFVALVGAACFTVALRFSFTLRPLVLGTLLANASHLDDLPIRAPFGVA